MKYIFLIALFLISSHVFAKASCDQQIYDNLYMEFEKIKFAHNLIKLGKINNTWIQQQDMLIYGQEDPLNFEVFRQLCHGQKATQEFE